MKHDWAQIIITPMILIDLDPELDSVLVVDHEGQEQVRFGCMACNMGVDEGATLPCPGFDIGEAVDALSVEDFTG